LSRRHAGRVAVRREDSRRWGHTGLPGWLTIGRDGPVEPDRPADDRGVIDQPPTPRHEDRLHRLEGLEAPVGDHLPYQA
jgi:hypothetical protein